VRIEACYRYVIGVSRPLAIVGKSEGWNRP
jgi:hypothetical protein